uniref:Uncharacterized protein n=1 Tax=Romanomermis culicivorax TaxID=13658 RepID=A0A915IHR9_ROMCU
MVVVAVAVIVVAMQVRRVLMAIKTNGARVTWIIVVVGGQPCWRQWSLWQQISLGGEIVPTQQGYQTIGFAMILEQSGIEVEPAMRLDGVVGFFNNDLFNRSFHVEVFIEDDPAGVRPVQGLPLARYHIQS